MSGDDSTSGEAAPSESSFSVDRRAVLSGSVAGVLGAAAVHTVDSDREFLAGGEDDQGSGDVGHTHDGDALGVEDPIERIGVSELGVQALRPSDLTGGDRLESIAAGNLGIDADGVLGADHFGGAVEVDGLEGAEAVQAAIDDAAEDGHDTVHVLGTGETEWRTSLEIPDNMTLDVSNALAVTVPEDHDLTAFEIGGAEVLSLITNRERTRLHGAENVTIRGGSYDLSDISERANCAGVWLHRCSNGLIDDVICSGAGTPIYDNQGSLRAFNLLFTACEGSEIRDSEGHDAGYDNIGLRGANQYCRVVRSGGTGGSSGTIQSARWGNWGLDSAPSNITYEDCWGRRIYDHGGHNITFDGCRNSYRIQTLGSDNVCIRNTQNYRGRVLLYTYRQDMSNLKVENMSFSRKSDQDDAITIGLYDGDLTNASINNVEARRRVFLQFDSYERTGNSIDWVEVSNSRLYGPGYGDSAFVTQVDDRLVPDVLRVSNCVCHDTGAGIEGTYGSVRVRNCAFRDVDQGPIDVDADDVETAMIDEW